MHSPFDDGCKSQTSMNVHDSLTHAPLALQIFHHLLGGGGPIGRREKRKKSVRRLVKKWLRNYFSQFFAKVKIVAPRAKKWPNFRVFCDRQTSFRKTSMIPGTIIARANPKTAFERELNLESDSCCLIWPEVNSLASRGHRNKKLFLSENFHRE